MPEPYVFIGTALPPLSLDEKPELSYPELKRLLKDNLSEKDYNQIRIYQRYFNLRNAYLMLQGAQIDPYGDLNENQLEEALIATEHLPKYLVNYLNKYDNKQDRLSFYPEVVAAYFREEKNQAVGILKDYLDLERSIRLVSSAFRAKKLGWDIDKELQFEDPQEELIAQLLAQKDSKEFIISEKYDALVKILNEYYASPLKLHKALIEYRFNKLEELVGFDPFSLDRILAYFIQLTLVEKWQKLNKEVGIQIVDDILKGSA